MESSDASSPSVPGRLRKRKARPTMGKDYLLLGSTVVQKRFLADLTAYLNLPTTSEVRRRIIWLLEQMLELEKVRPPVFNEDIGDQPLMVMRRGMGVPNPLFKKVAPAKYRLQRQIDQKTLLINRELRRFRFLPFVSPLMGKWDLRWLISHQKGRTSTKKSLGDGVALHLILDFAKAGYLNRLRRCLRCQEWFYASVRHQNFCSTNCQQKHYADSDEWRTKRRDYMRNYRQLSR